MTSRPAFSMTPTERSSDVTSGVRDDAAASATSVPAVTRGKMRVECVQCLPETHTYMHTRTHAQTTDLCTPRHHSSLHQVQHALTHRHTHTRIHPSTHAHTRTPCRPAYTEAFQLSPLHRWNTRSNTHTPLALLTHTHTHTHTPRTYVHGSIAVFSLTSVIHQVQHAHPTTPTPNPPHTHTHTRTHTYHIPAYTAVLQL